MTVRDKKRELSPEDVALCCQTALTREHGRSRHESPGNAVSVLACVWSALGPSTQVNVPVGGAGVVLAKRRSAAAALPVQLSGGTGGAAPPSRFQGMA